MALLVLAAHLIYTFGVIADCGEVTFVIAIIRKIGFVTRSYNHRYCAFHLDTSRKLIIYCFS